MGYMAFAKSVDRHLRHWTADSHPFRTELDIALYTWTRRGCDEALLKLLCRELFEVTLDPDPKPKEVTAA